MKAIKDVRCHPIAAPSSIYGGELAHSGFYVAILNREVNWCRFHVTPGTNILGRLRRRNLVLNVFVLL